jgi:pimeloyl-ACP methyl ester carboxylesterase
VPWLVAGFWRFKVTPIKSRSTLGEGWALPLCTRIPRDPNMAHRAVSRSEVLHWFTKPGGESHTFNMFPDLVRIQCPTLVMGGDDDPIHPIESQADIAAALPPQLVQFERFPNCGHGVIPDAPERAVAVIRGFIQH